MELLFEINPELAGHFDKCRCCFKTIEIYEEPTKITNIIANRFLEITQVELKVSKILSTNICQICDLELIKFSNLKSELIEKQLQLYQYLEDPTDQNKLLENDSAYAIKNEGKDNDNDSKTIKFEGVVYEPEVNIKTEPDILELKLNQYFSSENIKFNNEKLNTINLTRTKKQPLNKFNKTNREDNTQVKTRAPSKKKKDESPSDFVCPICKKVFTEKRKVKPHILRMHLKIKNHSCDICGYTAFTKFDIHRHQKSLHLPPDENSMDLRVCPDCGKSFKGNNHLTLHIRKKHLQITKYQCDHCSFRTYGKYEIRSHLQNIHVPKEFKKSFSCDQCNAILSSLSTLKVHKEAKHSGLRPHSCFCGKTFPLKESLKTHVKNVHKGERKFKCQFCDKRFSQGVRLQDHINNSHGTKQEIPCEFCGKVFGSTRNLKTHMVHHYEPKFKCSQCNKAFYQRKRLKEHEGVHSGVEFTCEMCNRTFQMQSSLKRHHKTHLKDRNIMQL